MKVFIENELNWKLYPVFFSLIIIDHNISIIKYIIIS